MGWWELRNKAYNAGELVYSFDQNQAASPAKIGGFDPAADVAAGYCLGLCVQWIALRMRGKDFAYGAMRSLNVEATYKAASDHATYLKSFNQETNALGSFLKNDDDFDIAGANVALAAHKLKLAGASVVQKGVAKAGNILNATSGRPGISLLTWHGPNAAHATAIDARPAQRRVNYFDPNFGHFQFNGSRFVPWFDWYMSNCDYGTTLADYLRIDVLTLA